MRFRHLLVSFVVVLICWVPSVGGRLAADEGMWTFDNPPLKHLKERYGFVPTSEWLDHLRLSSVRLNDGGSGSFVSADGLLLTNHHVARGQLQKLSTEKQDLVKDGFYAATPREELKAPDLEMNVLVSMENVTTTVQAATAQGQSEEDTLKARKAEMARIEKESLDKTGLRAEVVTLYHGGEYWLYRYKVYTDVRVVFAPEQQAAFFGGDPDNFTYPRHDLDFAILRAYDNGKPASTPHFLTWSAKGPEEGDLVFVSGHPGGTERLKTVAQLAYSRDYFYPWALSTYKRRLQALRKYAARGAEQARQAEDLIFGLENAIKAYTGEYEGLKNAALMAAKQKDEREFRQQVESRQDWKQRYGRAWDDIARVQEKKAAEAPSISSFARLMTIALQIVQYVAEVKKPDAERLNGFHESQLQSLRFSLLSPAPIYPEMDAVLLTDAWSQALERRGPDDPYMKAVLGGRSAEVVAQQVTSQTTLADPAVRKMLLEGGEASVATSVDPMIALARRLDPVIRDQIRHTEREIEGVETAAAEQLGRARFEAYGKSVSPDATFTLRLAYGTVSGYPMNGTRAPWKTTIYGLYDRALSFDLKPPYNLPDRLLKRKDRLDLSTPLNFVSTCDIIGGNSGSPVVNRAGELVGVIFDGNIDSLVSNYVYDVERGRSVAVHAAAIIEVLRKVYDAGALADALEGKVAVAR
jgi:hypothetical protein